MALERADAEPAQALAQEIRNNAPAAVGEVLVTIDDCLPKIHQLPFKQGPVLIRQERGREMQLNRAEPCGIS